MFDPAALLTRLTDAEVDFVVIGGLAATMHGGALLTADLDLLYDRSRPNLERLAAALNDLHVRFRGAEDLDIHIDARLLYAGDRFTFMSEFGDLDVLATADGAAPYADIKARAVSVQVEAFTVLVADLDDLIAMKRAVSRPKDHAKLAELLELREVGAEGGQGK